MNVRAQEFRLSASQGRQLAYETAVDGTRLLIRRIRPEDKVLLVDGFSRLSDRSRYGRFFTQPKGLSSNQLRYLTEVDHENHSAWIAFAADSDPHIGIGVGRWVRLDAEPEAAEIALTVVDDFQGKGLGRTLFYLCAVGAYAKGIRAFKGSILGENTKALRLLKMVPTADRAWDAGVMEVTIPLEQVVGRDGLIPLGLQPVVAPLD
jgi:GNAT superfamily N-acetyltransferase